MKSFFVAIVACVAPVFSAQAYCIYNDIKGRDVRVVQEEHPSSLRAGKEIDVTLKPGEKHCCIGKNLDCNPGGGIGSITRLAITIPGTPPYQCGVTEKNATWVKVTGEGEVRIVGNPKPSQASPFVARVASMGRDTTGPSGLACPEYTPKAK
jgi:hypothetical protein